MKNPDSGPIWHWGFRRSLTALLATLNALASVHAQTAFELDSARVQPDAADPSSATSRFVRNVEISNGLPPFQFELKPDLESALAAGTPVVGQIVIYRGESDTAIQTLDVHSTSWRWLTDSFETIDINMDGFQDLRVLYIVGGKWGQHSYWLYQPESGLFVTNALTAQLGELTHNGIKLNPEKMELRTSHFWGICTLSERTYQVGESGLVLLEARLHTPIRPGLCTVEVQKRLDGQMVTISNDEQEHEDPSATR